MSIFLSGDIDKNQMLHHRDRDICLKTLNILMGNLRKIDNDTYSTILLRV